MDPKQKDQVETSSSQTEDRVYTQAEVDAKINAVKNRQEKKVENNYVSREEYDALANKLKEHNNNLKKNEIKNVFLKNGGEESSFNDFISANKNLIEEEITEQKMYDLKKQKPYFFKREMNNDESFLNVSKPNPKQIKWKK